MKIRPAGAEFSYGPTDKAKLIVAFRNFANAPKNGTELRNTLNDLTSLNVDTDDGDDDDDDNYDDDDNDNKAGKFFFFCFADRASLYNFSNRPT